MYVWLVECVYVCVCKCFTFGEALLIMTPCFPLVTKLWLLTFLIISPAFVTLVYTLSHELLENNSVWAATINVAIFRLYVSMSECCLTLRINNFIWSMYAVFQHYFFIILQQMSRHQKSRLLLLWRCSLHWLFGSPLRMDHLVSWIWGVVYANLMRETPFYQRPTCSNAESSPLIGATCH